MASSKAIITGIDYSDPNASAVDIFRHPKNHPTAVASLIESFAKQTGFRPKEHGLYTTNSSFLAFKTDVNDFEYFRPMGSQVLRMELTGGPDGLEKEIASRYFPITRIGRTPPSRANIVASAFVEQIPSSADQALSGSWALALVALHGEDDNYTRLDISWVNIQIVVNDDGSVAIPPQVAFLSEESFEVMAGGLIDNAEFFAKVYPKADVKTVLDSLTTPRPKGGDAGSDHSVEHANRQSLYRLSELIMNH